MQRNAPCALPRSDRYLNRPRIEDMLKEAFLRPLTTVIAGPGNGKTRAVSSVLASMDFKYAWLTLTDMDNMTAVLWRHLVRASVAHHPSLAMRLNALGYPDTPAAFHQFLRLVEEELRQNGRFIFVLDDFHLIKNEDVLDFFHGLITSAIPKLSIVLVSREKPDLPLAGMLSKNMMARIEEEDLRFTKAELAAYYDFLGEPLNENQVDALYECTEGWIVAMYLVGLSLKRNPLTKSGPCTRAKVDIFALIEEEVFAAAPAALKKFLAAISRLDALPGGLVKGLAADSPEILYQMERLGSLVVYDDVTDHFRMHRLFKDFLTERGPALSRDEEISIFLAAARWYKKTDQSERAITHYWKCGHYIEALDIILSVRQHVAKDVAELFVTMIDETPAEIIKERPIMRVVKAQYLFNNNRIDLAQSELNALRAQYEAGDNAAVLGEVYMWLALISIVKQNLEFASLFKMADECLPNGSAMIDHTYRIAEGLNITGIMNPSPGELKRYQDALFDAAPYAARVMGGCGYGMEYLNAADAAFMVGDMRSAEKHAYEAVFRAQQRAQHGIEAMANFYLIRIFTYKGDYEKIALILKQMKEKAATLDNEECMTLLDIIEGWFFVKIGQPDKVEKWLLFEEETRRMLAPVVLGREYLVRSDYLLEKGRDYELLGFMKQSDVFYEKRGILYALIQNRITESIIFHYLGRHRESMDALEAAYEISHGNDLIMQYIEYGTRMRTVLQAARQDPSVGIPDEWLSGIQTKSSTYAKRLSQVAKAYNEEAIKDRRNQIQLSKRELEVLFCLCHGLTREEMADQLGLSPNRIKSILQSIFNKLGAINSLDAVRIATLMNLI